MIKASELRIGNYVKVDDLPIEQVTLETFDTLSKYTHHMCYFNGIELTEGWLVKFGFEKTRENEYFINNHTGLLGIKIDPYLGKTRAIVYRNASSGVMPLCKYVHQLQNLYYALFGEELISTKPQ